MEGKELRMDANLTGVTVATSKNAVKISGALERFFGYTAASAESKRGN